MSFFTDTYNNRREVVIWENEGFFSIMDNFPVTPGHILLISKREIASIQDLDTSEWQSLKSAVNELPKVIEQLDLVKRYTEMLPNAPTDISTRFIKEALEFLKENKKVTGYNHGVNDGLSAGQTVMHLHWHIIPRYDGDMPDPRGGVRYVIPEKGNYKV